MVHRPDPRSRLNQLQLRYTVRHTSLPINAPLLPEHRPSPRPLLHIVPPTPIPINPRVGQPNTLSPFSSAASAYSGNISSITRSLDSSAQVRPHPSPHNGFTIFPTASPAWAALKPSPSFHLLRPPDLPQIRYSLPHPSSRDATDVLSFLRYPHTLYFSTLPIPSSYSSHLVTYRNLTLYSPPKVTCSTTTGSGA